MSYFFAGWEFSSRFRSHPKENLGVKFGYLRKCPPLVPGHSHLIYGQIILFTLTKGTSKKNIATDKSTSMPPGSKLPTSDWGQMCPWKSMSIDLTYSYTNDAVSELESLSHTAKTKTNKPTNPENIAIYSDPAGGSSRCSVVDFRSCRFQWSPDTGKML